MNFNFNLYTAWSIILFISIDQPNFADSWSCSLGLLLPSRLRISSLCNLQSNDLEPESKSANEFSGFNPFIQKQRRVSNSWVNPTSRTLSLRKIQMDQLTETLLRLGEMYTMDNKDIDLSNLDFSSSGYLSQINQVLNENEGLLLEPIVGESDAPLDMDSIYTKEMSTEQRFDQYDRVMTSRLNKAQNMSVKIVLVAMKAFVFSRRSVYC